MSSIETFELRQAYAEQQYFDQKVTEVIEDLLPQLTLAQLERLEHECNVQWREYKTKFNPNQEVF